MRILIADDHRIFAEGLKNLLEARGYEDIHIAGNGEIAVRMAIELNPDVIFMDIRMPVCDGLEASMIIKMNQPHIKIIMLTTSESEEDIYNAIKYGASGYLIKDIDSNKLFSLLEEVAEGHTITSSDIAERILKDCKQTQDSLLTGRQLQVLSLIAKGKKYKDIAIELGISERTVKYHVKTSIDKVHLQNRQQLISYASKIGLIK